MRILVITSIFPRTRYDPEGSFILDQSLALSERGHEVEVVVVERPGGASRGDPWGLAGVRSAPYVPVPLRLGVGAWRRSVQAQLRSHRSELARGYDAAVVHDELVAAVVEPSLEADRIPWVLVVHGANRNPAMDRASGLRVKNDTYGRAGAIVSVGGGVGVPLWARDKEHPIPNGASVPEAVGDPPERTFGVMAVSVSGLRPGKGIEDNLRALSRLATDGIDVGYWIAGDGPLRPELGDLTRRLGIEKRVRFLGSVARDRLGAVLEAADFFALPSSPEAFGIAYVEAMQAGNPVIGCRGEGPQGFITTGEDGFLVEPGDIEGLEEAWRALSVDADRRSQMGANARRAAAPLTWAANARQLEAVLEAVVERYAPLPTGRDLWWLGVEPTSYMLDDAAAVRSVVPDARLAFIDGGGDVSTSQLYRAITRRRAKVVLLEGWGHPQMLLAMALAVVARVPFIVKSDTHRHAGVRRSFVRGVVRSLAIRPLVRRAAVLLPGGTPQARYVRELVGRSSQPLLIGHMTVDTEGFERAAGQITPADRDRVRGAWGAEEHDVVLLFVGRLVNEKGLAVLLRALEQLRDTRIKVVVYGSGPLAGRLRAAAVSVPVHLAGTASKQELAAAYASADLFVLPSIFEPWGLVVNEAMATGLPCVVSDAVGSREDLIDPGTGWVFPSGDPEALAQMLRTLAGDGSLRRIAGAAARERMRDWSMDTYADSVAHAIAVARGTRR